MNFSCNIGVTIRRTISIKTVNSCKIIATALLDYNIILKSPILILSSVNDKRKEFGDFSIAKYERYTGPIINIDSD